jgi:hypothetical protein
MALTKQTETIVGLVFLGLMVVLLIVALSTFQGQATLLLIVTALICLGVGLFFFSGPSSRGGGDGQSQQQSVVLGDGQVITQSANRSCPGCGAQVASTFAFCPHCGAGTR